MDISEIKGVKTMKDEFFTRFILENNKLMPLKVKKSDSIEDINRLLKKEKVFFDIMSRM